MLQCRSGFPGLHLQRCLSPVLATIVVVGYVAIDLLQTDMSIGLVGLIPMTIGVCSYLTWKTDTVSQVKKTNPTPMGIGKRRSLQFMFAGAVVFSLVFFSSVLTRVSKLQTYDTLLVNGDSSKPLGAFGGLEPTWVFYGEKPIYVVIDTQQQINLTTRGKRLATKTPTRTEAILKSGIRATDHTTIARSDSRTADW